jgi:hypothetical protein
MLKTTIIFLENYLCSNLYAESDDEIRAILMGAACSGLVPPGIDCGVVP